MFFSAMRVSWLSAGEASPTISLRCVLKGGASPGKSAMYGGSENTAQMRPERHHHQPQSYGPQSKCIHGLILRRAPCERKACHVCQLKHALHMNLKNEHSVHVWPVRLKSTLASSMRKSMNALVRFIYFWPLGLLRYISKISRS